MITHSGRTLLAAVAASLMASTAMAADTIKLGLSVPMSGGGAAWGLGSQWACKEAAQEINAAGGVKVAGKVYEFSCIAYDNKYTSAEGTKVAQTLLNRDGVKFVVGIVGTPPYQALQSLSERQGVLIFTHSWSSSTKGPKFPLTFTAANTPNEIFPSFIKYIASANPQAKTVALLGANDSTGKEVEPKSLSAWKDAGVQVVGSDFYERGTTDFQPIALRLTSKSPAIIDLGAISPGDAGLILKELAALGWKGVKAWGAGSGAEDVVATAGAAANGVYMSLGVPYGTSAVPGPLAKLNEKALPVLGVSLGASHIAVYDTVHALKAGMEKAQSVEPTKVAAVLPSVRFNTLYGGTAGFGGTSTYGSPQQTLLPYFVTQVREGKLVGVSRMDGPKGN